MDILKKSVEINRGFDLQLSYMPQDVATNFKYNFGRHFSAMPILQINFYLVYFDDKTNFVDDI